MCYLGYSRVVTYDTPCGPLGCIIWNVIIINGHKFMEVTCFLEVPQKTFRFLIKTLSFLSRFMDVTDFPLVRKTVRIGVLVVNRLYARVINTLVTCVYKKEQSIKLMAE